MVSYKKVNKATARKMYNNGITIFLLPCKVRDCFADGSHEWLKPCEISLFTSEESENKFDRKVNAFEYYNCNAELGYYAHFFVTEEDVEKYKMCSLLCS